ncbi:MAG TPA: hypothetical protein VK327_16720 [Candidatus Paceibacterota bacterium]|nr:hypothetical protein [Candidatus Paceibacterota bacterium]
MSLSQGVIQSGAFFEFDFVQFLFAGDEFGCLAALGAHGVDLAGKARSSSDG